MSKEREKEKKRLEKEKKLVAPRRLILSISITSFLFLLSLFILFFPFKNGSAFENMIYKFTRNTWTSLTIFELITQLSIWIFFVWKLTNRILETKLYFKKHRLFNDELNEKGKMNIFNGGSVFNQIKNRTKYIEYVINEITDAFLQQQQPLSPNAVIKIREVIENTTIARKEKIAKVREIIEQDGKKINDPTIAKAIKQI